MKKRAGRIWRFADETSSSVSGRRLKRWCVTREHIPALTPVFMTCGRDGESDVNTFLPTLVSSERVVGKPTGARRPAWGIGL